MNPVDHFRRTLAQRILHAALLAAASSTAAAGCSNQIIDGTGDAGGTGGAGGAGGAGGSTPTTSSSIDPTTSGDPWEPWQSTNCFAWPQAGGVGGSGGSGDGGFGAGGSTTGEGGASPIVCPAKDDAAQYMMSRGGCGIVSVETEGTFEDGECCYTVLEESCAAGRPYLVDDRARLAPLRTGDAGWSASLRPDVASLSPEARASLADAWTDSALMEHASVASFSRFALELMAVGAPADLVADAQSAALDEIRHARLCFALASAYAGAARAPGPFPFGGPVAITADLAAIAAATVKEGCVGETLAAMQAAEQLARAKDPAVREVLVAIAEDEARHAELAWRAVAWAIRIGGEAVRAAVGRAFDEALASLSAPRRDAPLPASSAELAAHGQLDAASAKEATLRALAMVVRPGARALTQ